MRTEGRGKGEGEDLEKRNVTGHGNGRSARKGSVPRMKKNSGKKNRKKKKGFRRTLQAPEGDEPGLNKDQTCGGKAAAN